MGRASRVLRSPLRVVLPTSTCFAQAVWNPIRSPRLEAGAGATRFREAIQKHLTTQQDAFTAFKREGRSARVELLQAVLRSEPNKVRAPIASTKRLGSLDDVRHAATLDKSDDQIIREIRIPGGKHVLAPVRPRLQAAGLQCLKLQVAVAFPDPQARAFPGTELSWKIRSPNFLSVGKLTP